VLSMDVPAGRTYTVIAGDGFNGTFTGAYTIGWSFALTDVARAMRALSGVGEMDPAVRTRFDVSATGGSTGVLDIADAVWTARNAFGLQALP